MAEQFSTTLVQAPQAPPTSYLETKPHYNILDGLRGVACVMVVAFHLFEAHSGGDHTRQIINHGYLAVDFFFALSGFVVGYAYDDRWEKMSMWTFFKLRLIRLQPMVIMGSIIGALAFYFQASSIFPTIQGTPVWKMLLVMLVGCTLLPLTKGMDIRGWQEMHPLDGPAWSLFFEYIANISYALVLRKLSQRVLAALVLIAACVTVQYALTTPQGDFVGGWSIDALQLRIGFTRLLYPFLAGLLLSRCGKLAKVNHAFLLCSVSIIILLSIPRFGGTGHPWMNGLYEACCILFFFPAIILVGAGGSLSGEYSSKICKFLGDISYPVYITHYPLIYIYTGWVVDKKISVRAGLPIALLTLISSILMAYACLRLYDLPVRSWLRRRFLVNAQ